MEHNDEEQERQRLVESTQRSCRRASDEDILTMIESPRPPFTQGVMAFAAASIGRGALVLRALERGVLGPGARCDTGTIVHIATIFGPLELLKSLILVRGFDPNEARTDVWRPLPITINNGREQEAMFLINEAPGVDIDAPKSRGFTPLMVAAEHGTVDVLRALWGKGADVNAKDEKGFSALHKAIVRNQRAATLYLINEAPGVDIEALDGRKRTALTLVAFFGDIAMMQALVGKGADLNAKNEEGATPLHAAIQGGQEEAALYLVEEAAAAVYDPDAPGLALASTALSSRCRVMRAILRRMRADGVDSSTVAAEMGEAALCAIGEKELEALKALVEEGLDVDHAPVVGMGGGRYEHPLFHLACMHGNRETAALLAERGCDPLARNGRGEGAHHVLIGQPGGLSMLKWLMASFPIPVDDPAAVREGLTGLTMLHHAPLRCLQRPIGDGAVAGGSGRRRVVHVPGRWTRLCAAISVRRGEGACGHRRVPAGEGDGSGGCTRGGGSPAGAEREAAAEAEEGQGAQAASGGAGWGWGWDGRERGGIGGRCGGRGERWRRRRPRLWIVGWGAGGGTGGGGGGGGEGGGGRRRGPGATGGRHRPVSRTAR